jgi:stromal membrane-associated protein
MTDRARAAQIRRLEACLAKPENRECFDCCALRPRWASTNLGIFICMRCAGIHRSLGTHISKVKSINMDVWEEEMIRNCEVIGNGPEGHWRYEANMPSTYQKPKMNAENRDVEHYIRLKFESKAYYPRPGQNQPHAAEMHSDATQTGSPAAVPTMAAVAQATAAVAAGPLAGAATAGHRVVQAVAIDQPQRQDQDLFGAFAATRSVPAAPAQPANDFFGSAQTAAPAAASATDFFGAPQSAPTPQPAQTPDIFGAAQQAPRPALAAPHVDFFGQQAAPPPQQPQQQFFQQQPPAAAPQAPQQQQYYHQPPSGHAYAQPPMHAGQPDFFSAAAAPAPTMTQTGASQSMYQRPAPPPPKQASPLDPFAALASARPKTPPKHEEYHASASTASRSNNGPSGFDAFGGFSAQTAPATKPKADFSDFF